MKVNFKWWQGVICVVRAKFYFRYSYLAFSGARAESLASHIWIFPKGRLFKRTVDDERLAYVLIFMQASIVDRLKQRAGSRGVLLGFLPLDWLCWPDLPHGEAMEPGRNAFQGCLNVLSPFIFGSSLQSRTASLNLQILISLGLPWSRRSTVQGLVANSQWQGYVGAVSFDYCIYFGIIGATLYSILEKNSLAFQR